MRSPSELGHAEVLILTINHTATFISYNIITCSTTVHMCNRAQREIEKSAYYYTSVWFLAVNLMFIKERLEKQQQQ